MTADSGRCGMNAEPKRLWLEALRSGEYVQGSGSLRNVRDVETYCCLGVACEVAIKAGVDLDRGEPDKIGDYHYEDGGASTLPMSVQNWLGTDEEDPSIGGPVSQYTLAGLNDSGSTFAEIADRIEAQL